ncbi:hypothetical protein NIIDMKKI_36440 [Mycobacterium kansasii]|uniref:Class II aldolase/adducin N-terminal domain-containing protein n=1 Tax=Mycobacterium kansasii TaxID=1768 RepID=A0A7G1IIK7_MYCKA|nr:hypothetical protein NIIDMKKI_36440 [Mycobacterium kansasii]
MNTAEPRPGGLEVWAPAVMPPIGVELSHEQALAVAFRHLAAIGFAENMAGHITWQPDGHTDMLVNPWGCGGRSSPRRISAWWTPTREWYAAGGMSPRRSTSIPNCTASGTTQGWSFTTTPTTCVLAALGRLPELVHQTGSLFLDDLCLVDTYHGEVDSASRAADLAAHIGDANLTILANHGVIATGRSLAEAVYRAASIERVCKLAYDVMLTGKEPAQMKWADMAGMQRSLVERAADVYWAGAARMAIKADPEVLR